MRDMIEIYTTIEKELEDDGELQARLAKDPDLKRCYDALTGRNPEPTLDDYCACFGESHGTEAERLVDASIASGRIDSGKRGTWLRRLSESPALTAEILAELPVDKGAAAAAFWSDADEKLGMEWVARSVPS